MVKPQLSYIPGPHEQQYYEGLFLTADIARGGNIGGAEAVGFFSRSKLQVATLKSIWTLADQPVTNSLDRKKFATAIRLIQLSQNGLKAQGANLGGPPGMRPAMFEGVSGVTLQLPSPESSVVPSPPGALTPQTSQTMVPPQAHYPQQPQQSLAPQHGVAPGQESQSTTPSVTSAPPSPASRAGVLPMPPSMSTAITTQDPYTISPQEQSRYGDLFPNYAKDGYIYGKEAVELFTRSGVPQDDLKKIWNMVDLPVDNRLDKLEFALAMHLIVCISKKGLPLPPSLPVSLKNLKYQQHNPTESQVMPPSIIESAAPGVLPPQAQGVPPHTQNNPHGPFAGAQEFSAPQGFDNQRNNSLSISDAFEGLSPVTATQGYEQPVSEEPPTFSPRQEAPPPPAVQHAASTVSAPVVESVFETAPQIISEPVGLNHGTVPVSTLAPVAPPKPTEQLAASYYMGDDRTELDKLKDTLQKLQAENISLKAQMGSTTEEEREVKEETIATIEEISRLTSELAELRGRVLAAKSRLLESTAELKAAKEKNSALSHLITETRSTYETLQEVGNDIHSVNQQLQTAPAPPAPPVPVADADIFGGWGNPAPMYAPVNQAPVTLSTQVQGDAAAIQGGAPHVPNVDAPVPNMAPTDPNVAPPVPGMSHNAPMETHADPWSASAPVPEPWTANAIPPPVLEPVLETASSDENVFGVAPLGSDTSSLPPNYPASEIPTQQFQQQFSDPNEGVMGGGPAPPPSLQQTHFGNGAVDRNDVEGLKRSAIQSEQTSQEADETYRTLASEVETLRAFAESAEADAMTKHEKASKKRGMGKKKATKEAEHASIDAAEKKKLYLELQAQASDAQALAMESKRQTEKLRDEAEQAELTYVSVQSTREAQPYQNHAGQISNSMNSDQSNSEGMPDPSQVQAYPNYGYDSRQQPPAYGNEQQPSAYGNEQQPSAYGNEQQPSAYGNEQQPPAYGNGQQPPAHGNGQQPPAHGNGQQPPAYGNGQQPPAYGNGQQPPAYGNEQQPPSYGNGYGDMHKPQLEHANSFGFGAGIMGGGGGGASIPTPPQNTDAYANPF